MKTGKIDAIHIEYSNYLDIGQNTADCDIWVFRAGKERTHKCYKNASKHSRRRAFTAAENMISKYK